MKVIGVIPARYNSSRFPGKPLAIIGGKPMLCWVYERAKKAKGLDDLLVATDDERISQLCKEYGMKYMMTSVNNKTGAERIAEVAEKTDADIYLNIQGDEPLIEPEEIEKLILYKLGSEDCYVGLKSDIVSESEVINPNIVKVVCDLDGFALYFSRTAIPYTKDVASVKRCMGLYAYDRKLILKYKEWKPSALEIAENGVEMLRAMEHGERVKLLDTSWQSIGVDLPEHISQVEIIMKSKGLLG